MRKICSFADFILMDLYISTRGMFRRVHKLVYVVNVYKHFLKPMHLLSFIQIATNAAAVGQLRDGFEVQKAQLKSKTTK